MAESYEPTSCAASIANSEVSGTFVQSTLASRRQPLETGFECEFVEKPRELQPECPICLHILREPYQSTCCGNSFCRMCIERVKAESKPCPTCNQQGFDSFHDKRLQHTLYDFRVVCPHKNDGCEWTGELRELEKHLNSNPPPETQLQGCPYEKVECVYCHAEYERENIQFHQGCKCRKRPYSCEYCRNYESTCDDVTDNHWPVCPSRPVPCPNDCGVYPERQNLQTHLANECTKQEVKCPFSYAGCCTTLHPSELQQHLHNNLSTHLYLLAEFNQRLVDTTRNLSEKVRDLERQLQRSVPPPSKAHYGFPADKEAARALAERSGAAVDSMEVQDLIKEVRDLTLVRDERDQAMRAQNVKIKDLERQNQILTNKIDDILRQRVTTTPDLIEEVHSHLCLVPVTYTVTDFTLRRTNPDMAFKPHPFYTFPQGYKMQFTVNVYGDGSGKGSHMSIFLSLTKGEFDNQLKWPFRGSVTIQLLDQESDSEHYADCITYHDGTPKQVATRVIDERRSSVPWGKVKFIAHADILPKFVKNDTLKFCISKVEIV